jgi:hypothetical protein
MLEIDFRFRCGSSVPAPAGGTAAMSWIDDVEKKRQAKKDEDQRKSDVHNWSSASTPSMTVRLINQLKSDAEEAVRRLGVRCLIHLDGDKLQISHSEYPTFFLQIDVPRRGVTYSVPMIRCLTMTRKSASAQPKETTIEIPVSCLGSDECYFIIGDNERASEQQVSGMLLSQFFESA